MTQNDVLLTVKEVSKLIKCNADYVHKLRKSGLLPFIKLGCYKVRKESLEEFLKTWDGWDVSEPTSPVRLENETLSASN